VCRRQLAAKGPTSTGTNPWLRFQLSSSGSVSPSHHHLLVALDPSPLLLSNPCIVDRRHCGAIALWGLRPSPSTLYSTLDEPVPPFPLHRFYQCLSMRTQLRGRIMGLPHQQERRCHSGCTPPRLILLTSGHHPFSLSLPL
jgi:hypothetical protein